MVWIRPYIVVVPGVPPLAGGGHDQSADLLDRSVASTPYIVLNTY